MTLFDNSSLYVTASAVHSESTTTHACGGADAEAGILM